MKHQRPLGLLLLLLISFFTALSQQPQKPQPGEKMSEADHARFETLRGEGFEALYNLDYEGARKRFKEIASAFPSHPAGPQFLAATLWAETLNESRRLQASLYNSESFFKAAEDKPNPKTVEEFRALTRQATQLAKARLKRDKQDIEALYFLGATEGLKAAFAAGVERRFMGALGDGSNSVDRHREVIKLDPNFHDAELTIGFYDYIVGGLPLPVKILASIAGARGSKKKGLQTLERVAKEGRWARDDAKALLIVLYKREKRYADALTISRELAEKYPRNYLFKLEAADALVTQAAIEREANHAAAASGAEREALAIFESLLKDRTTRDTAARSLDLIHYRYGEALFTAGEPERAAKEFLAAATVAGAEQTLATMSRLHAAKAYDLAGKRNEALAQYKLVLSRPDIYNSHEDAKRGLREPYKMQAKAQQGKQEE
jgi:tetratricopeptide (TPR) repeat protein